MLNAWRCELCDNEISFGEPYIEMPDGTILCTSSACITDYAREHFIKWNLIEEDCRSIAEEENYEQEREARQ